MAALGAWLRSTVQSDEEAVSVLDEMLSLATTR